jgi:hypothetical protein
LDDTDRATAGFCAFTNRFSYRACPKLLQTGNVHDRRLAALPLGEIGPAAEKAIPALLETVNGRGRRRVRDGGVALEQLARPKMEKPRLREPDRMIISGVPVFQAWSTGFPV